MEYVLNQVNLGVTFDQHFSWKPHVERLWKDVLVNFDN